MTIKNQEKGWKSPIHNSQAHVIIIEVHVASESGSNNSVKDVGLEFWESLPR